MRSRGPKVLVATSIAESKCYVGGFLSAALGRMEGKAGCLCVIDGPEELAGKINGLRKRCEIVTADLPEETGKVDRIAALRNITRTTFLGGDWTHLYFHDSDVIPPAGIIPSLLALDAGIATGLCPLRDWGELGVPILSASMGGCPPEIYGVQHFSGKIIGCGMACCLIRRDVLERTEFREGISLEGQSEDFKFCIDSGEEVQIDTDMTCWHVDAEGMAGRMIVYPKEHGAVWEDYPASVHNRFGPWKRGAPRFHMSEEELAMLGPGFSIGEFARVELETKRVEEVLAQEGL